MWIRLGFDDVGGEEKEQGEKEPPTDGSRSGSPHERHTGTGSCLCSRRLIFTGSAIFGFFVFFILPAQQLFSKNALTIFVMYMYLVPVQRLYPGVVSGLGHDNATWFHTDASNSKKNP